MPAPSNLLSLLEAAHGRLLDSVAHLDDDGARKPSGLPGWSVGHVLTHIARNGDAFAGMTATALRGDRAVQYPGGNLQREEDIDAGAGRSARVIIADLDGSHRRLAALWDLAPASFWTTADGTSGSGLVTPATEWALRRLREVEVHRTDTGLAGLSWEQWPDAFVDAQLGPGPALSPDGWLAAFLGPDVRSRPLDLQATDRPGSWRLGTAPGTVVRGSRRHLLAWLLGRADQP